MTVFLMNSYLPKALKKTHTGEINLLLNQSKVFNTLAGFRFTDDTNWLNMSFISYPN